MPKIGMSSPGNSGPMGLTYAGGPGSVSKRDVWQTLA
jgi:hypothetical protein